MQDPHLIVAKRYLSLCYNSSLSSEVPLRIVSELEKLVLADPEFNQRETSDLICEAQKRCYVVDRASAIAVLKGVVGGRSFKTRKAVAAA